MVRWAVFLFLFAGVAAAGCASGDGSQLPPGPPAIDGKGGPDGGEAPAEASPIKVHTDRDAYRDGESIVVTIENDSSSAARFVLGCGLNLCYQSGEEWICAERECEGPMTVLEPGDYLDTLKEAQFFEPPAGGDVRSRYRLDYYIGPERMFSFTNSNAFTVQRGGRSCREARQIALNHARSSPQWDSIDTSRAIVRWQSDDESCVVDFAWLGADQILPGMWSEGYYVKVGGIFNRVIEANAYVR